MNNINQLMEGLSHPVLQAMACTLGSYNYTTLRQIYEFHKLRVTPIEENCRVWLSEGILVGDQVRRYESGKKVRIPPTKWIDILRTVRLADIPQLLVVSSVPKAETREAIGHLVSALIKFLNGEPFIEELMRTDWNYLTFEYSRVMELLGHLVNDKEFIPFSQQIEQSFLMMLFHNYLIKWMSLDKNIDMDIINAVFLGNKLVDDNHRSIMNDGYLYYSQVLKTGRIDEILGKLRPGGDKFRRLQCFKYIHDGEPAKAFSELSAILKEDKQLTFPDSLTNFVYALSICLTDSAPAIKAADKLMKDKNVGYYNSSYAMLLVLHHFIKGDAAEFYKIYPLTSCKDKMGWRLACLFLRHYQILDPEPQAIPTAEDYVKSEGLVYLQLLYSDDFPQFEQIKKQLQKQTGLSTSLLPKVKKMEKWERVINQIMKLSGDGSNSTVKKKRPQHLDIERVAYVVNLRNYYVQPKLQKSKDGGITWSKGRNIALKSFGQEAFLSPLDKKVAAMVNSYSYGWYGQVSYELHGERVIAALAGCQSVYSEHTEQRIDIVEEPLMLQVQPKDDGYSVRSNVNLEQVGSSGYNITEQGDKQVTVTKVTREQKKTLELLRDVGIFPKESKKQLTELLQSLSSEFTVMSPLLKNATDMKRVEASPKIAVQISPDENQLFSISLAVKPFGDKPPYQKPGKGMEIVTATIDGEKVQTERDLKAESQNLKAVEEMLGDANENLLYDDRCYINTAECLSLLEQIRQHPEVAFAEWPQGIRLRVVRPMITADMLRLKISSAGQWFEVEGDINIGDKEKIKIAEMLERLRSAEGNFIRIEGDEFVALSEQLRKQLQAHERPAAIRS